MKIAFYEIPTDQHKQVKKHLAGHEVQCFTDWFGHKHMPDPDTEVLVVHTNCRVDDAVLKQLPDLKYILTRTAGYDHIDLAACKERRILVSNVPGQNALAVAEMVFGLLLTVARDMYPAITEVRKGEFSDDGHVGAELFGKTIGIVGTGAIGMNVMRIAHGFGMNILAWDVKKNPDAKRYGAKYVVFAELLKKSDVITLHVPAVEETFHIIDKKALAMMKQGSFLVNTARGSLVDTGALLKALLSGRLAGAALDVVEEENALASGTARKLPPARRLVLDQIKQLITLPNVVVTPHMAHATEESVDRVFAGTLDALDAFIKGRPINLVK
jgi:D-lactate dehydrogenase